MGSVAAKLHGYAEEHGLEDLPPKVRDAFTAASVHAELNIVLDRLKGDGMNPEDIVKRSAKGGMEVVGELSTRQATSMRKLLREALQTVDLN